MLDKNAETAEAAAADYSDLEQVAEEVASAALAGHNADEPVEDDDGSLGPALLPFVNGEPGVGEGQRLVCVNPSNGEPFARVACAATAEVDQTIETAIMASALWRSTAMQERSRKLHRLADLILEERDTIAALITLEQGKPAIEALNLEVLPALDHLRYLADHAPEAFTGEPVHPRRPLYVHKQAHYMYEPLGLVAIVSPYTFPFALPLIQAGAALAMGNAVLVKPSEQTPVSALRIGELCQEAGFPPGVVNILPATKIEALYLVSHPKVDKVFLTGNLETGQQVMATAGCVPRPVVLSLGGKHPAVVAADADIERAARGIVWGALSNGGQNCGGVERVYVEEPVAQRFLDRVLKEVDALRVGDPQSGPVEIGPLISEEHRKHVHGQVCEAVGRGAQLLRGGRMPEGPGFFYPPTVVLGPPQDSWLLKEETQGPVIPVVVVESLERAIMLANDSEYSHTASGWTSSSAVAERLMSALQAGVVTINDVLYPLGEPAATKAGYRLSGLGNVHGIAGLREMCRRRFVSHDPLPAQAPVMAFPYDGASEKAAEALMTRLHAKSFGGRLRAYLTLLMNRRFRSRVPRRFFFTKRRSRSR